MQQRHQQQSTQYSEHDIDELFGVTDQSTRSPSPTQSVPKQTRLVRGQGPQPPTAPIPTQIPTQVPTQPQKLPRPALPNRTTTPDLADYEIYEELEPEHDGLPQVAVYLLPWTSAFVFVAVGKVTTAAIAGPGMLMALLLSPLCFPWIVLTLLGGCQLRGARSVKTVLVTILIGWTISLPFQPVFLAPLKSSIPELVPNSSSRSTK